MKHYIIWNLSSEWDDFYGESVPTIEYISSDLEDAIAYFDKTFGKTDELPADKWKYEYTLEEWEDGYKRLKSFSDETKIKTIKSISNVKQDEKQ